MYKDDVEYEIKLLDLAESIFYQFGQKEVFASSKELLLQRCKSKLGDATDQWLLDTLEAYCSWVVEKDDDGKCYNESVDRQARAMINGSNELEVTRFMRHLFDKIRDSVVVDAMLANFEDKITFRILAKLELALHIAMHRGSFWDGIALPVCKKEVQWTAFLKNSLAHWTMDAYLRTFVPDMQKDEAVKPKSELCQKERRRMAT